MTTTSIISTSPQFFPSYTDALNGGRLSESQWKKRGRVVKKDAQADYVIKRTKRVDLRGSHPLARTGYTVVREVGSDLVEALAEGWSVYSVHQTEALPPSQRGDPSEQSSLRKTENEASLNGHSFNGLSVNDSAINGTRLVTKEEPSSSFPSSSPPLSSPYDRRSVVSPCGTTSNAINCSASCRAVNDGKAYVPESWDWETCPVLKPYQASVAYIFHVMYLRSILTIEDHAQKYEKDDFVELKYDYLDAVVPDFRTVIKLLLNTGVLERDYYEKGKKSYGYRFADPELRRSTHRLVDVDHPKLWKKVDEAERNMVRKPVLKWLKDNVERLKIKDADDAFLKAIASKEVAENGGQVEDKMDAYKASIQFLQDGYVHFSHDKDFSLRVFQNVTNLKRELRTLLRVSGEPLVEIDIKNSQLLFLALEMRKKGVECGEFTTLCEQDIYQWLADKGGWRRDEVKAAITQRALFAANGSPYQRSPIKKLFDRKFPTVADYIRKAKTGREKRAHVKLAKQLQRAEAHFVIFRVCERFRKERPNMCVVTVHDSVLMLRKDADYVKTVMEEEFEKLGVYPRLEVKTLCQ